VGTGLLIMRLFQVSRSKIGGIYHVIGLINLVFGLVSLLLLSEDMSTWIAKTLALLIGLLMYWDIARPTKSTNS
jgi:hypothetical protein